MSNLDTMTERNLLRLMLLDVRKFWPQVKVSKAHLHIFNGYKSHSDRWMEWEYQGVKVEGYYHSAYGAQAEGWRAWLRANMTPEQYEAYQNDQEAEWAGKYAPVPLSGAGTVPQ